MEIGLIGTVMHDEIETVDGRRFESFGGILYNLLALGVVTTQRDCVRPIAWLGADHLDYLKREFLDGLPMVDSSALQANPGGTDSNVLKYVTHSSRQEKMTIRAPRLTGEMFKSVEKADAVLVNFISGEEMDLDGFRSLRERVKGPVYLDVHNLGKQRRDGRPVEGHRFTDWPEWFRYVDVVQANEWEAERLLGLHPESEEDYRKAALRFLAAKGPRVAVLTLGGLGCALAWREGATARFARIPAMPDLQISDTTGCGDCFSAGFLVEYLRTGDPLESAVFAATLSGMNCQQTGLQGLHQIGGVREKMQEAYPAFLAKIEEGWRGEPASLKGEWGK